MSKTVGYHPVLLPSNKMAKIVVVVEESKLILVDPDNEQRVCSINFQDMQNEDGNIVGYFAVFEPGGERVPFEPETASVEFHEK